MSITCAKVGRKHVLRLEGDIDISCASDLKRVLIETIASRKKLRVDLSQATTLDITALQLLWAAARELKHMGGELELCGPVAGNIVSFAADAGLDGLLGFSSPQPASPEKMNA